MELEEIATKRYSTLTKSPEVEPYHRIQFNLLSKTPFLSVLPPLLIGVSKHWFQKCVYTDRYIVITYVIIFLHVSSGSVDKIRGKSQQEVTKECEQNKQ